MMAADACACASARAWSARPCRKAARSWSTTSAASRATEGPLRNMLSQLAVPMRRKGKVIGALNLLNEAEGAFTPQDEALLRQFAAHVAVAIENARLFKSERQYVDTLETLAEIGREMSSILDLDALLTRIASLTKRLIDYRTFGILLLDEATQRARDEAGRALRQGRRVEARSGSAKASSAGRRCTRSRCSSPTSRRIRATSISSTTRAPSW